MVAVRVRPMSVKDDATCLISSMVERLASNQLTWVRFLHEARIPGCRDLAALTRLPVLSMDVRDRYPGIRLPV